MKCSAVRFWLLSAAAPADLPAGVRAHLADCPGCARQQGRLVRLEQEVRGQSSAASMPPLVRQRLTTLLAARSSPAAPRPPRRRLAGSLPWAATLLLAFGLGWLLSGSRTPQPSASPRPAENAPAALTSSEELLLARILESDRRLARTSRPAEQLQLLDDMAADLRQEAIRRARRGATEDVALVVDLHQRVVRRGVVGRALALPPGDGGRLAEVCERLRLAEDEAERAVGEVEPGAADRLRPLSVAVREARGRIDRRQPPSDEPDPPTADPGSWRGMLVVLVMQGIQLAEESDPQRRRDSLSELDEIDSLLGRAGRVLAELERTRPNDPGTPLPDKLTAAEEQRVKELEKTCKELEKALRRMKNKPAEKEREREREREHEREREKDRGKERDEKDDKERERGQKGNR
jgi:hypothetical protein